MIVNYDHKTFIVQATGVYLRTNGLSYFGGWNERKRHLCRDFQLSLHQQIFDSIFGERERERERERQTDRHIDRDRGRERDWNRERERDERKREERM